MPDIKHIQNYSPYLDSRTKRAFDVCLCVLLLVPVVLILLLTAALVLCIDGRPIFFVQKRIGRKGKLFRIIKIRTLIKDAERGLSPCKYNTDSVVTKTGRFLRKHRLDELPQIFQVLIGQMSLVGPRPELPTIAAGYSEKIRKRLDAKPGITGLWQIKGKRDRPIHEDIKYDFYYLRKANLLLDIKILVQTIPFVLNPKSRNLNETNCVHTFDFSISE